MREELKKLFLKDEEDKVMCSLNAIYVYDENNKEDDGEVFFLHPLTSDRNSSVSQCLQGWSEQDEVDNINWYKLVECIEIDGDLLNKLCNLDEINYYI